MIQMRRAEDDRMAVDIDHGLEESTLFSTAHGSVEEVRRLLDRVAAQDRIAVFAALERDVLSEKRGSGRCGRRSR